MGQVFASLLKRFIILLLSVASVVHSLEAASTEKIDKARLNDAAQRSRDAAKIISTLTSLSDETLPKELLDEAKAVAVFPDLKKVNLLFRKATGGYGVICSRLPAGWSPPAYYSIGMHEFGFTSVSFKAPGVIMLFMNDKAVQWFHKGALNLRVRKSDSPGR